jgi:DNA repair exonuclease SbcCD ATPase subunit
VKLLQLRVRGYRKLHDLAVDLDHDRLLVVGPNEAGKSTLMDALLAGLYGLAPAKRGSGHTGALRAIQPWSGEAAALVVRIKLDDGRTIEVDWDFSAEQTRVIDHDLGEDVTADYAPGTHGWLDVGERLLGLPAGVFRQVTCVGEGQLASLTEETEIRQAVLRLTDSGVDVMVEQALARLDDAARQATSPRSNSATRRNQLGRELAAAEEALEAATRARDDLEREVGGIRDSEVALTAVRRDLARILASEEKRESRRRGLRSEIDRAHGRLAEAELRLAAVGANRPAGSRRWSEEEVEEARQVLVTPPAPRSAIGPTSVAGWSLAVVGALALAFGVVRGLVPAGVGGILAIAAGVYFLTRGRDLLESSIEVGEHVFPDRTALMTALDEERARRDHDVHRAAVERLQKELDELVAVSSKSDDELEVRLREAEALQTETQLQLERQRASYDRGSTMVPEVAPLEEQVAQLRDAIAQLDSFGAAAVRGATALRAAAEAIRRDYAPRLQEYLGRDLSSITGGRYTEAIVNDRFQVMLRAPETGSLVDMGQLSRGTQQQVYLLLRLGLLEVMGSATEPLPLFLDDALALADDGRRAQLLRVLEAEARQVIYFTAGEAGASIFDPRWHRVVLPAPTSEHAQGGTGQLPMSLVEGPV